MQLRTLLMSGVLASCGLGGVTVAQFSAPAVGVSIQQAPPVVLQVARQVRVQPARLELMLSPGHSTGTLTFSVFSEVPTEVFIRSSSPLLVSKSGPDVPVTMGAYAEQSVSLVALAPHSGTLSITNKDGEVIATVPYVIAPPRDVSQTATVNYSPNANSFGLSYSVSPLTYSPLDPVWSAAVDLRLNTRTQDFTGGISVSVSW
jgi:hypothetical protein